MKPLLFAQTPRRQSGHLLLSILVITAVLSLVAVAYVKVIFSNNSLTVRSQAWNNCMPLVEAGLEDAMGQLTYFTNLNLTVSGWTGTSQLFTKTRGLGDGYYSVTINYSNSLAPVVTSIGYLPAPLTLASAAHGTMTAAAFVPNPNIKYISRTVRVILQRDPAFPQALVVKNGIDFNGNNIGVDSFNSSAGAYAAATARDKGNVTLNSDFINAADLGNADIKGTVTVGPKATFKIGPNGCVGSVAWHTSPGKGIQAGWIRRDSNVGLSDVEAPWTGGALPPNTTGGSKYVFDGGNYEMSSLSVAVGERMHIKNDSVIYVTGNVNISGEIKLGPGVKVKIYVKGPNCTLSGIYDKSDIASEFLIYGLPTLKTLTANGVAAGIYAPGAKMTLTGNNQFYGSATVESLTMTGNSGFHYDEAMTTLKGTGYRIDSWNEL